MAVSNKSSWTQDPLNKMKIMFNTRNLANYPELVRSQRKTYNTQFTKPG